MIILRLKGGLGNQLFQYVYSVIMARENETIVIDISFYQRRFDSDYAGAEMLLDQIVNYSVGNKIVFKNFGPVVGKLFWKISKYIQSFSKIINIKILDGYFTNSNLYPRNYDYNKLLTLVPASGFSLTTSNSVLIHVRKGDYTNLVNSQIYFNCDVDYFKKCVQYFDGILTDPKFYIMTNDKTWVKENLNFIKNFQIIDIDDSLESFRVMNLFSNFIISNSTFSWWPAFLSKSSNVCAPAKWYLDNNKNLNLYPDNWIKF